MLHFIIRSIGSTFFGTPNGQAWTQFEQAMHRAVLALWTMPNSSFVIASAGQTFAQTGSSQCMQTWTEVCVVRKRST